MSVAEKWLSAGTLEALQEEKVKLIKGGIAVFYHEEGVYAVDNRCPHLGFPLHMGSLCDGILTCHWHHARFDVCSGGTLDPWADDVPSHEVACIDGEVWVNPQSKMARGTDKYVARLREGLQQNIGIVIAKAIVGLIESGYPEADIARIGIEFGTRYGNGWSSGLTILTAMTRVLPKLDKPGKILALYQGLTHVARGSSGRAERHLLSKLPSAETPADRLSSWYRSCIEVRDTQGAERILLTAIEQGAADEELMEIMLLAVTDHFYLDGGHTFDFHNKAFEALELVPQELKVRVLSSLVPLLRDPTRSEELHQWQAPVNLVAPLKEAFARLQEKAGSGRRIEGRTEKGAGGGAIEPAEEEKILQALLGDRPLETIALLGEELESGRSPADLARLVALAAAERIVRFHTQNDFGDWVAVLHTFTYAHAVHAALRRHAGHPQLLRAIYYGAVSIYLDRFLNVPPAPRPDRTALAAEAGHPDRLLELLDKRQQVGEAARWVAGYLNAGGDRAALINTLGHALLREDADFHTFQMFEAAIAEYDGWDSRGDLFAERARETMLLAATRYLAAHAPTARELPHTARIAWRLHRGERLFEEE